MSKNTSPASTREVRAWAAENAEALAEAGISVAFLNPPSGKVRGRVPAAAGALFTEATGRPYSERSEAEAKTINLTLQRRDKNGRGRGKVTVAVPVAEVRSLGGAPAKGRLSQKVLDTAVERLQEQRGW